MIEMTNAVAVEWKARELHEGIDAGAQATLDEVGMCIGRYASGSSMAGKWNWQVYSRAEGSLREADIVETRAEAEEMALALAAGGVNALRERAIYRIKNEIDTARENLELLQQRATALGVSYDDDYHRGYAAGLAAARTALESL